MATATSAVKIAVRTRNGKGASSGATNHSKAATVGKMPSQLTTVMRQRTGGFDVGRTVGANQASRPVSSRYSGSPSATGRNRSSQIARSSEAFQR